MRENWKGHSITFDVPWGGLFFYQVIIKSQSWLIYNSERLGIFKITVSSTFSFGKYHKINGENPFSTESDWYGFPRGFTFVCVCLERVLSLALALSINNKQQAILSFIFYYESTKRKLKIKYMWFFLILVFFRFFWIFFPEGSASCAEGKDIRWDCVGQVRASVWTSGPWNFRAYICYILFCSLVRRLPMGTGCKMGALCCVC